MKDLVALETDPDLDPLQKLPAYRALLKEFKAALTPQGPGAKPGA